MKYSFKLTSPTMSYTGDTITWVAHATNDGESTTTVQVEASQPYVLAAAPTEAAPVYVNGATAGGFANQHILPANSSVEITFSSVAPDLDSVNIRCVGVFTELRNEQKVVRHTPRTLVTLDNPVYEEQATTVQLNNHDPDDNLSAQARVDDGNLQNWLEGSTPRQIADMADARDSGQNSKDYIEARGVGDPTIGPRLDALEAAPPGGITLAQAQAEDTAAITAHAAAADPHPGYATDAEIAGINTAQTAQDTDRALIRTQFAAADTAQDAIIAPNTAHRALTTNPHQTSVENLVNGPGSLGTAGQTQVMNAGGTALEWTDPTAGLPPLIDTTDGQTLAFGAGYRHAEGHDLVMPEITAADDGKMIPVTAKTNWEDLAASIVNYTPFGTQVFPAQIGATGEAIVWFEARWISTAGSTWIPHVSAGVVSGGGGGGDLVLDAPVVAGDLLTPKTGDLNTLEKKDIVEIDLATFADGDYLTKGTGNTVVATTPPVGGGGGSTSSVGVAEITVNQNVQQTITTAITSIADVPGTVDVNTTDNRIDVTGTPARCIVSVNALINGTGGTRQNPVCEIWRGGTLIATDADNYLRNTEGLIQTSINFSFRDNEAGTNPQYQARWRAGSDSTSLAQIGNNARFQVEVVN